MFDFQRQLKLNRYVCIKFTQNTEPSVHVVGKVEVVRSSSVCSYTKRTLLLSFYFLLQPPPHPQNKMRVTFPWLELENH